MSELTLTIMRLGLLVALWLFVFSVVGVLRGDLYGTQVTTRRRRAETKTRTPAAAPTALGGAAGAPAAPGAVGAATPGGGGVTAPQALPDRSGFWGRRATTPRKLVVTEGPLSGTSLPLRAQGTLIGRAPECALVLDDDYASGRHARIYESGGTWYVEDLGSTNGTYVDNRRITAPEPLGPGTSLRIGRTVVGLSR